MFHRNEKKSKGLKNKLEGCTLATPDLYGQTYVQQLPLGPQICDHCGQVVIVQR